MSSFESEDHHIREKVRVKFQKIIEVQGALIDNLQKQIKEWEEWNASSKDRHAKGRAKAKKHKPKK